MGKHEIIAYCESCPQLEIADLLKFLYQSCFGCEHLVTDCANAVKFIKEEAASANQDSVFGIEKLDGPFCRVHLNMLSDGLSAEMLGRLFVLSSEKAAGGLPALKEKLDDVLSLSRQGLLPFSEDDLQCAINAWEKSGFAPCHHSERFRQHYHPAYRVIAEEFAEDIALLARCENADTTLSESNRECLQALSENIQFLK